MRRIKVIAQRRKSAWPVRKGHRITMARKRKSAWTYTKKDLGAPGKGRKPKGLVIKKGMLPQGITAMPMPKQKAALRAAVRRQGAKAVHSHLLFQRTLRAPEVKGTKRMRTRAQLADYNKIERMRKFVANKYSKQLTPKKAIKKWSGMSHQARKAAMPGG